MSTLGNRLDLNKVGVSKAPCFVSTTVCFHPFFPLWIRPTRLVGKEHPLVVFTGHVKTLLALKESQVKFPCLTSRTAHGQSGSSQDAFRKHQNPKNAAEELPVTDLLQLPLRTLPCWERAAFMKEAGSDHEQYPKQAWKYQLTWGLWETTQQVKALVTKPSDLSSNLGAPIAGRRERTPQSSPSTSTPRPLPARTFPLG